LLYQAPLSWAFADTWLVVTSWSMTNVDTGVAATVYRVFTVEGVVVARPEDV
jgi:hypothetical protein